MFGLARPLTPAVQPSSAPRRTSDQRPTHAVGPSEAQEEELRHEGASALANAPRSAALPGKRSNEHVPQDICDVFAWRPREAKKENCLRWILAILAALDVSFWWFALKLT